MPAISLPIDALGPIIRVAVGVSQFRVDALKRANLPVPQWQVGTFLIDTGASGTCIDHALVQPLGIPPTGAVNVQTPSTGNGSHSCYQYDVLLYIPGGNLHIALWALYIRCLPDSSCILWVICGSNIYCRRSISPQIAQRCAAMQKMMTGVL
jgi:hypothetical protein